MRTTSTLAAATLALMLAFTLPGCAVSRGQSSVGEFVDDTAITTAVKARFIEDKMVDAAAVSVETLKGEVVLSGFAKNATEKNQAEALAKAVKGVKSVRNQLVVRSN